MAPSSSQDTLPVLTRTAVINQGLLWVLGSFILLSIAALVLAVFANYKIRQDKGLYIQQEHYYSKQLASVRQQQKRLNDSLQNYQSYTYALNDIFNKKTNRLTQTVDRRLQEFAYQKDDWMLLKAQYYLELAQINAYWSQDNKTTVVLLSQAEQILSSIINDKLFAIRQAITDEITQLNLKSSIDTVNILTQLNSLQTFVMALTVQKSIESSQPTSQNRSNNWFERLKENLALLKPLVSIHKSTALFTVEEFLLIKNQIYLNLQYAQGAILQKNNRLLHLFINQALTNLQRLEIYHPQALQKTIEILKKINQIDFDATKADISGSLLLLNQYIETHKKIVNQSKSKDSL